MEIYFALCIGYRLLKCIKGKKLEKYEMGYLLIDTLIFILLINNRYM